MSTVSWEIEVSESQGGDFEICPAGNYASRICGLFDIGHHTEPKTAKDGTVSYADVHKLVIVVELSKKQSTGQPFTLGDRLTFSMNDKANLFDLVKNVKGRAPVPGEKFSPVSLLGEKVMTTVVHKGSKDGKKTYVNIGGISGWVDGLPEPAWQITPSMWSVREGTPFPEAQWHPYVFGKSIKALAGESKEACGHTIVKPGGFKPGTTQGGPATSSPVAGGGNPMADARPAPGAVGIVYREVSDYPADLLPLLFQWKLTPGFTDEDVKDKVTDPAAKAKLLDFANDSSIPF